MKRKKESNKNRRKTRKKKTLKTTKEKEWEVFKLQKRSEKKLNEWMGREKEKIQEFKNG